jgi:hypothetical protein
MVGFLMLKWSVFSLTKTYSYIFLPLDTKRLDSQKRIVILLSLSLINNFLLTGYSEVNSPKYLSRKAD